MDFKNMRIAHRGNFSYKFPENTLMAFNEAVKNNVSVELDLHILKDNTVVVFHDNDLSRASKVNVKLKDLTYEELKRYKIFDSEYSIPTFKEVLGLVNGKVLLDIELKHDNDCNLVKEVINLLKDYKGEFILKSFDPRFVKMLKKYRKKYNMDFNVGLLLHNKSKVLPFFIYSKPDFVSYSYKNYNKFWFKFVSKFKPTLLYNINSNLIYNNVKGFGFGLIGEDFMNVFKENE